MLSTLSLFAGRSCHTNSFFDENSHRATVTKIGREVAPHDFHFRTNSAPRHSEKNWQGGRATWFPFWIEIRESAVLEWGRATIGLQKECHVRFCPIYGIPREQNASKTRETCKKHARNTRVYPASDCTAPARLSPSFMRRGYYPCRCHEKVKILKGMYSKWGCPYSQKLLFQI